LNASATVSRPRCSLALAIALVFGCSGIACALPDGSPTDRIFADAFDPPPVADFIYGATGLAVTFTDQSVDVDGMIGTWAWDFGDGTTSTLQNPAHTYSTSGTYVVTETVVDSGNGEYDVAAKSVTVAPCGTLTAYLHDFKAFNETGGHPDFESYNGGSAMGLVFPTMAPGGVPTLQSTNGNLGQPQVTSAASFAQWFTDDPVNIPIQQTLTLAEITPGVFKYANAAYFPIDGQGFGNYQPYMSGLHNFHFTTALHAAFQFNGGETFTFVGDDDVWVYINGHLAIDMGGVHGATTGSVTLDLPHQLAFALTPGQTYKLDLFQAQRHTVISNFSVQTTIQCLADGH
jgi:fibro-slime domain-containing protein